MQRARGGGRLIPWCQAESDRTFSTRVALRLTNTACRHSRDSSGRSRCGGGIALKRGRALRYNYVPGELLHPTWRLLLNFTRWQKSREFPLKSDGGIAA